MGKFRHLPDDTICINSSSIPLSFFLTLEPTYTLPAGYITRYYEQGISHYVATERDYLPQTFPYADGDTFIANEATYMAAYNSYLNPAPTLSAAKSSKIAEVEAYAVATIKEGHVIVGIGSDEFFSSSAFLNKLINQDLAYTRAGALPGGYYINDVNYAQIIIASLVDLEAIIDRIIELHYLTDLNIDIHRAAINALGTVGDVTAYDYSTGWQTVPY